MLLMKDLLLCCNLVLTVVQVHFEESQFEVGRQDGKRLLKWNAVPTLFDVPNKPKTVTLRRTNPAERKRKAAESINSETGDTLASATVSKRQYTSDHQYCKSSTSAEQEAVSLSCTTSDHNYASGISSLISDVSSHISTGKIYNTLSLALFVVFVFFKFE